MSNILASDEVRRRFKSALEAANITAGGDAVGVLKSPPAGWVVPDANLPAVYVFTSGEGLGHESLSEVERTLFLDAVLMAKPGGDPMDALGEMQLAIERVIYAAGGFGFARSCRLTSVEIAQNQGAVIIGSRVMKYEIVYGVTPGDPSL